MEKEIKRLYVCSNFGEYPTIYDAKSKTIGWGFNEISSESLSTSYQTAYNYMRRVNRIFGCNICNVVSMTSEEYQGWYWKAMVESALFNDKSRRKGKYI